MDELLLSVYGILQSLAFAYIPYVKDWYENRLGADKSDEEKATLKRGVQALGLLIVAVGMFALNCADIVSVELACTRDGAVRLVFAYILALGANQATYWVAPQTKKRS